MNTNSEFTLWYANWLEYEEYTQDRGGYKVIGHLHYVPEVRGNLCNE